MGTPLTAVLHLAPMVVREQTSQVRHRTYLVLCVVANVYAGTSVAHSLAFVAGCRTGHADLRCRFFIAPVTGAI